jgi:hypothetical protein
MTIYKAKLMLGMGWILNGLWLVLEHDQDAQVFRCEVHSAAGWLWSTRLPYTTEPDEGLARETILAIGAAKALTLSKLCAPHKVMMPHAIISARLAARRTPLLAPRLTRDRDNRTRSVHGDRRPVQTCAVGGMKR